MENNKVILISDNNEISKTLVEKLVLLRKFDEILVLDDVEFCDNIKNINPALVFLLESEDRELTVQNLRIIRQNYKYASVVLIALNKDFDFILSMYDQGVNDFIFLDTHPAEILIKSINALKKNYASYIADRDKNLLLSSGNLSGKGFYTENVANELMLKTLDEIDAFNSSFMIISCDELDRISFDVDALGNAIKTSVRSSDFVIELKSGKFYLYLRDTKEDGAVLVFKKISEKLDGHFRIKAGIAAVENRSFRDLEQRASVSLTDAMLGASDYVVYKERELPQIDEWALETEDKQKDFKLFKQSFLKKLDKIITPVFYRMQTSYEGLLPDTKIEQYAHETQCIFHLKHPKQTSRLTIVYPGFAKVLIYITHSGWDSPDNKEIFMPLKQLSEPVLTQIVETFIEDFRSCINS